MFTTVLLFRINSWRNGTLAAVLLLSTSVSLAIERANVDVLLFILIVLAGKLYSTKRLLYQALFFVIVFSLSVLKIYPIISFLAIPFLSKDHKEFMLNIAISILLILFWLYVSRADLMTLTGVIPRPMDGPVTGFRILLQCGNLQNSFLLTVFGLLLSIGLAVVLVAYLGVERLQDIPNEATVLFAVGLSIIVFTYYTNTNYDYRWIFFLMLVPLLLGLLNQSARSLHQMLGLLSFLLAAIVMWAEGLRILNAKRVPRLITGDHYLVVDTLLHCAKHFSCWILITVLIMIFIAMVRSVNGADIRRVVLGRE
jgi:hypothetical protein